MTSCISSVPRLLYISIRLWHIVALCMRTYLDSFDSFNIFVLKSSLSVLILLEVPKWNE